MISARTGEAPPARPTFWEIDHKGASVRKFIGAEYVSLSCTADNRVTSVGGIARSRQTKIESKKESEREGRREMWLGRKNAVCAPPP